ncbi:hypothetical protein [Deinococcus sp. 23YEL01]|uniref:hypothetical protein n=1 Tax=Deinococcus sp. 23YEL01 TaxID=2745871 RepID=UPI001E65CD1A|nr:hypothetical protein [Deinococcus sp. 23YEL01]MCD0169308.1 hypothetical protein [Deinococcus sp. 23YEL01]
MGLDAEVLAIGAFRRDLVEFLEYPADFYKNTRDGATVIVTVFQAVTSDLSYELASYFGIDPWDFNSHVLDPEKVDVDRLRGSEFSDRVEAFLALKASRFTFYYLPNG